MTYTIQEVEQKVQHAKDELAKAEAMLAEMKKQKEPRPLEEGKDVPLQLSAAGLKKWQDEYEHDYGIWADIRASGDTITITASGWGNEAVKHARQLLEACGGTD